MRIEWLETFAEKWRDSIAQGRMPHAVLLTGPPGVGKRAAADWMARTRLGTAGAVPVFPFRPLEHADLRWIAPFEDKSTIGIEQIRELVSDIGLTSYAGRGKVAVIEPAQLMTSNAANSLLKTLEEPPGDALLILVAMLVIMTLNLVPAVTAVLLAAAALILTRCLSMNDAYASINWESALSNWRCAGFDKLSPVEPPLPFAPMGAGSVDDIAWMSASFPLSSRVTVSTEPVWPTAVTKPVPFSFKRRCTPLMVNPSPYSNSRIPRSRSTSSGR